MCLNLFEKRSYINFQRVYDNALEVAALERAQAIINIEWKLVDAKRSNFLEYINKNFSPKVVFYDDDPTNPPDGEIHGLTLMTKKINEQVKTLGSIIVDFREKDVLHRTMSMNMADAMEAQSKMMTEILKKMKELEEKMSSTSEEKKSPYKLYYPQSDTDTETGGVFSRTQSTSPDVSYTTAPTRSVTKSSNISGGREEEKGRMEVGGWRVEVSGDDASPSSSTAAPVYFPEMVIRSQCEESGGSRQDSSSLSCPNIGYSSGDSISQNNQVRPTLRFSLQQPLTCPEVDISPPVHHPIFRYPSSPTQFTYPSRRPSASSPSYRQQGPRFGSLGEMCPVSPLLDREQSPHRTSPQTGPRRSATRSRSLTSRSPRPGYSGTGSIGSRTGSGSPRYVSSSRPGPARRPSRFRR